MRNLSLISVTEGSYKANENETVDAIVIDGDSGDILVASASVSDDSDSLKIQVTKSINGDIHRVGSFVTRSPDYDAEKNKHVVSLRVVAETHLLVLILRNGELATLSLDDSDSNFASVGEVESGIVAAEWSPDESLLVLITGEDKLLLMSSSFDTLSETPVFNTSSGEEAKVNVGWGSKSTQFHGSLGKQAASESAAQNAVIGSSPDDDTLPRISWRGDASAYVVSSLDPSPSPHRHRVLRTYNRQGILQSTSEAIAGLEHQLSWRPSGSLITSTQRFGKLEGLGRGKEGRHDVVFFEPNGLRHGEFSVRNGRWKEKDWENGKGRFGYRVREVAWNADSTVLAVWVETEEGDIVQLWTTGNYHWYLKQEIRVSLPSTDHTLDLKRFTGLYWHPEQALRIILTTSSGRLVDRTYAWEAYVSRLAGQDETGQVAVVDGNTIKLTPFRIENVPPPMSSHTMTLPESNGPPVHSSFSATKDAVAFLWENEAVQVWDLNTNKKRPVDPELRWEKHPFPAGSLARQVFLNDDGVVILRSNDGRGEYTTHHFDDENDATSTSLESPYGRLVEGAATWQSPEGAIFELQSELPKPICRFPAGCQQVIYAGMYIGLRSSGDLYAVTSGQEPYKIGSKCNSFTICSDLVIFTTSTHNVYFAPLADIQRLLDTGDAEIPEWEKRRVERGSRIVTAVSSSTSLILQMPRGNLETIYPRPMVMSNVRRDIDANDYRSAFMACRKHRIDLNVLVDHNRDGFLSSISQFVEQVENPDFINLLLSGIGGAAQSPEDIAILCDAIRSELERRDLKKYVTSVLTAHVVKTPPDYENGLLLLHRLRETDPSIVEEAIKYIIFLADANRLFDEALGMYDFKLVLMIAEFSQKDPREYIPFLRDLRSLPEQYQRFKIDEHLKRFPKALRSLHLAGEQYFSEALTFIEKHQLYLLALSIWENDDINLKRILDLYGTYSFDRREFEEAALAFRRGSNLPKAMVAHERALQWREVFELAYLLELEEGDIEDLARRISDELASKARHPEAAQVVLDYCDDLEKCRWVPVARKLFLGSKASGKSGGVVRDQLTFISEIVHPAVSNAKSNISEEIEEIDQQFTKQRLRMKELRTKKEVEPDAFYGTEDNIHDVDVMTDVSTPYTAYTRYTVAPSTASKTSKRSNRQKKKTERKAGRKGTVEEEEYLLNSITKLAARVKSIKDEAHNLLPHLMELSDNGAEARELQAELLAFEKDFHEGVDEIWTPSASSEGPPDVTGRVDPREKVGKPTVVLAQWCFAMLNLVT